MDKEKMLEYGKFSVQLEMINNAKLPETEIAKHLKFYRQELKKWKDILRLKVAGENLEELEQKVLKKAESFSFN
jgi:hypothetical protein